ncbi:acyl carrier protein [Thalassotalea sp. G2M2-11]|uniref:acyl carrier protein n=1 Tax=Thalassotalea sp. G2M2-11 TaxID=2787627 RepID=UPI0019D010CF|nr:acyl carrier protein [Thalassotalea sp. G2M2-11]
MTAIEKLKSAFVTALEISEQEVNDSLSYSEHPAWDSTAHMILIAQLEADFDVMIDIDDIIDMSSFNQAKATLLKYDENLSFE